MWNLENRALELINRLQDDYLVKRDIRTVLDWLDEQIDWIGTGEDEEYHGIEDTSAFLWREYQMFPIPYSIVESSYKAETLTDNLCLVKGHLVVEELETADVFERLKLRLSVIFLEKDGALRIRQLHISAPSIFQMKDEFFPRILAHRDTKPLRMLLDQQTKELMDKNRDLNTILENLPGGVMSCEFNEDLSLIHFSDGFLRMFGYTREEIKEIFGDNFSRMIYPDDLPGAWRDAREQLKYGNSKKIEYRVLCKDGSLMYVLDHGQLVKKDGRDIFYCILIDITERRIVQEKLKMILERHKIILDQTTDIIFEWDMEKDLCEFSENWEKKFGYFPVTDQMSNKSAEELCIHPADFNGFKDFIRKLKQGTSQEETECRISHVNGDYIWCRFKAAPQMNDSGRPGKVIGVIIDINQEKEQENRLREQAEKDALTGLYNKGTTEILAEKYIKQAGTGNDCALMVIDIDNFKYINDSYGHLSGDVMLSEIAVALRGMFRSDDLVGRIGGDEFAVVMRGITDMSAISAKARDILLNFNLILKEEKESLSCSIGIAQAPRDGKDFHTLYKKADLALYQAKNQGKNKYMFYSENFDTLQGRLTTQGIPVKLREVIDSDKNIRPENNSLAQYIFSVLYHAVDVDDAVPKVLEIVGKQFNVSRVYIFQDSEDGTACSNTYEWCNVNIDPQKDELQNICYEALDGYLGNFNEDGIFYCRDVSELSASQRKTLEKQGIKSVLQCLITDGSKNYGFIGFDECNSNRFWTRAQVELLSAVSKVIGTFLIKKYVQEQLDRLKDREI